MKWCYKCGETKGSSEFNRDRTRYDGLRQLCRECDKVRLRKRWADNPEHYREKKRQHYIANRERLIKEKREWQKDNKDKFSAHQKVHDAIKSGKLIKKPCQFCGDTRVDAHHDDYSKPLDIRWVCKKHHQAIHHGLIEQSLPLQTMEVPTIARHASELLGYFSRRIAQWKSSRFISDRWMDRNHLLRQGERVGL